MLGVRRRREGRRQQLRLRIRQHGDQVGFPAEVFPEGDPRGGQVGQEKPLPVDFDCIRADGTAVRLTHTTAKRPMSSRETRMNILGDGK